MQCCKTSGLGLPSDVDVRTESDEIPRQGDCFVTYELVFKVSARATIQKRVVDTVRLKWTTGLSPRPGRGGASQRLIWQ